MKRRGCGSLLVGAIATLLAIIFVITAPLALLAYDTGRVIFNPPLLKRVLADEVVNSDLIPLALEWFSDRRAQQRVERGEALTGITEPDIVLLMSFLDRDDWREIKKEVLTPEILIGWVSVTIDGVYTWIDSNARVPQITYELDPFKNRVDSEHGVNSIMIAFSNLAPCNAAEIADFESRLAAAPAGTEVLYNLCQFPDPWTEDQVGDYRRALHKVVEQVPPRFALTEELVMAGGTEARGAGPEVIKQELRLIRTLMRYGWIVPLVLLLLLLAVAVRSWRRLGKWWGIPLLIVGLFTLLLVFVYRFLVISLIAAAPLSEVPPLVLEEAKRIVMRLAGHIFQPLLIQGIVATVVGILLMLLLLIKEKKRPEEEGRRQQATAGAAGGTPTPTAPVSGAPATPTPVA